MNEEGWKLLIINAVDKSREGKEKSLDLLAAYLNQIDMAQQILRDKGYGWTGLSLLEIVQSEIERIGPKNG
jgi:hypothetical protein